VPENMTYGTCVNQAAGVSSQVMNSGTPRFLKRKFKLK